MLGEFLILFIYLFLAKKENLGYHVLKIKMNNQDEIQTLHSSSFPM